MPRRSVERIAHSALTNHRIPSRPEAGATATSLEGSLPRLPGLTLFNPASPRAELPLVTRLAAYGELLPRAPALQPHYYELLAEAARSAADDPVVLGALGHKALAESSSEAVPLLSMAEAKGAPGAITYLDLSEALLLAGRTDEAVAALERGERLFPFSPAIRKRLVLGYIRQKTYSKAKTALESYVMDFPEDDFMRGLLKQVPR
jgi:tetratricopeptide (TPR) repeat protein